MSAYEFIDEIGTDEIDAWVEQNYDFSEDDEELAYNIIEVFDVSEGDARRAIRRYYEDQEEENAYYTSYSSNSDFEDLEDFEDEEFY